MSSGYLSKTGGVFTYDFTDNQNKAYNVSNAGQKEIGSGIWVMFTGDGDRNGIIGNNDKILVWDIQTGTKGYLESDYNLDAEVNNPDKNEYWLNNLGLESQVPD
jgi:hypothetical protein